MPPGLVLARKRKSSNAMERVVEDLILEAFSRGDFSNLSGSGKPLKSDGLTSHLDSATFRLNKILMDQGYKPDWVDLHAEIKKSLRQAEFNFRTNQSFNELKENIVEINKNVFRYNLIVPSMHQQLMPYDVKVLHKKFLELPQIIETQQTPAISQEKPVEFNDSMTLKGLLRDCWRHLKLLFRGIF